MLFKSESEVITILYITKNNYNSLKKTVTLQEVVNNTNIKYITLYKVLQKFIQEGYLKEGLKKGKYKTFFATSEGIKISNSIRNELK